MRQSLTDRRSNLLTLGMLALLVYFLLPLFWLVVAATKSTGDLFSTFGLWLGRDFNLFTNIRETFSYDDGVYARWMLNTLAYSVVSAGVAALLCALGGYGFAKYRFRGNNALFGVVLGSIMVPTTALAMMSGMVARQAAMIAYLDNFKLMMLVCFAAMPLLLLMRRPKRIPQESHLSVE